MCLLALFFRMVDDAPVVVGANREEFYARGGEPPQLLDGPGHGVGGRDPVAGGTWFGVNGRGVLVAVTNRMKTDAPAQPRSRGLLARELLACPTAKAAAQHATRELSGNRYAGCNLVCLDADDAVVLEAGDWLRVRPLPPGIHVLTNHDVNDASDRRVGHALWWLAQLDYETGADCLDALRRLCAQNGSDGGPAICFRKENRGTVSSSLVALREPPKPSAYLHAQGPPDTTPYVDYSHLLLSE
jgi:uncharacterized protein with NRDE domain